LEWASVTRVKKKDALTKVVDLVVDFWTNETSISPNKRDVVKHRTNKNKWEEHVTHFLE
jgi:sulfur relay (sulfurtransferase) DsrC/TusE family protein